ncbi:MAG: hypothetical protein KC503_36805 [Myxococcales bacterium]|nr:hypothetical protein [Myxococcales bacterium]
MNGSRHRKKLRSYAVASEQLFESELYQELKLGDRLVMLALVTISVRSEYTWQCKNPRCRTRFNLRSGQVCIGRERLAKVAGVAHTTVTRALNKLLAAGWLLRVGEFKKCHPRYEIWELRAGADYRARGKCRRPAEVPPEPDRRPIHDDSGDVECAKRTSVLPSESPNRCPIHDDSACANRTVTRNDVTGAENRSQPANVDQPGAQASPTSVGHVGPGVPSPGRGAPAGRGGGASTAPCVSSSGSDLSTESNANLSRHQPAQSPDQQPPRAHHERSGGAEDGKAESALSPIRWRRQGPNIVTRVDGKLHRFSAGAASWAKGRQRELARAQRELGALATPEVLAELNAKLEAEQRRTRKERRRR